MYKQQKIRSLYVALLYNGVALLFYFIGAIYKLVLYQLATCNFDTAAFSSMESIDIPVILVCCIQSASLPPDMVDICSNPSYFPASMGFRQMFFLFLFIV